MSTNWKFRREPKDTIVEMELDVVWELAKGFNDQVKMAIDDIVQRYNKEKLNDWGYDVEWRWNESTKEIVFITKHGLFV